MIMLKPQMTPRELADLTGYSVQTINKWIHAQGWKTRKIKGVKGGKAHTVVIDERVRHYVLNTSLMRKRYPELNRAEEPMAIYTSGQESIERQMTDAVRTMSDAEQQRLAALLVREGVTGLLRRLGISDESE
ncbi:YfeC-like transcriptional regulator [Siccibacter turicensis]|uniref:YfeC-like transcriptional regulator n=1 Tax=Siccibacter turicensis TaxID=357233 RepID=UPI0023F49C11|nr:YfeC-like transcriptional regulator [Siccibacter turicensis]